MKRQTYTDSALSEEQIFLNIPHTTSTTTTMSLNTENPVLEVDADGNGSIDKTISPSSTLTGDALTDTQAPVTTVQIEGTPSANNTYTSNVTRTFSSVDSGSGVLKTLLLQR